MKALLAENASLRRSNSILRRNSAEHGLNTDALVLSTAGISARDIEWELLGHAGSFGFCPPLPTASLLTTVNSRPSRPQKFRRLSLKPPLVLRIKLAPSQRVLPLALRGLEVLFAYAYISERIAFKTPFFSKARPAGHQTWRWTSFGSCFFPAGFEPGGFWCCLYHAKYSCSFVTPCSISTHANRGLVPQSESEVVDLTSDEVVTEAQGDGSSPFSSPNLSLPRKDEHPRRSVSFAFDLRVKENLEREMADDDFVLGTGDPLVGPDRTPQRKRTSKKDQPKARSAPAATSDPAAGSPSVVVRSSRSPSVSTSRPTVPISPGLATGSSISVLNLVRSSDATVPQSQSSARGGISPPYASSYSHCELKARD
ncbi:hypothetical protein PHMEG_00027273 [Phytophthora megakarya]|uniref:Uncharacterized protein n=1 Tax=Phytophthora megakarya TaxID=4795 RepID=A0A225V8Z3_9STRA|nr:hypothetical protein PHMEG_00027273 [Phytophthora megakarya]